MLETPKNRQAENSRGQGPLWFIIAGLGVVLFSSGVKDEGISDVVFWLGVAFSIVGVLYWAIRPKHGLP